MHINGDLKLDVDQIQKLYNEVHKMGRRLDKTRAKQLKYKLIISTLLVGAAALIVLGICYINIV